MLISSPEIYKKMGKTNYRVRNRAIIHSKNQGSHFHTTFIRAKCSEVSEMNLALVRMLINLDPNFITELHDHIIPAHLILA